MSQQTTLGTSTGQHVYVGIDSHKTSWKVCIIAGETVHKPFSQNPDPQPEPRSGNAAGIIAAEVPRCDVPSGL